MLALVGLPALLAVFQRRENPNSPDSGIPNGQRGSGREPISSSRLLQSGIL